MTPLTDQQLHDFQAAFDWKTGYGLPDGRALGVPGKRGDVHRGLDPRVRAVGEWLDPAGKRILEVGCCEGGHTVQLAELCGEVVGLDVRPHNIAGALLRAFVHGTTNVRFGLTDVRDIGTEYGSFDIVFHVGVLYHLDDPAAHLARVAALAPDLLLDTHYADDSLPWPEAESRHAGRRYAGKVYCEGGWDDVFSGAQPTSTWLTRPALLNLLDDIGFDAVEVCDDRVERNGPRLTLVARQTAKPATNRGYPTKGDAEAWECRARALEAELAALKTTWPHRLGRALRVTA